jgi:hypothetical protein
MVPLVRPYGGSFGPLILYPPERGRARTVRTKNGRVCARVFVRTPPPRPYDYPTVCRFFRPIFRHCGWHALSFELTPLSGRAAQRLGNV